MKPFGWVELPQDYSPAETEAFRAGYRAGMDNADPLGLYRPQMVVVPPPRRHYGWLAFAAVIVIAAALWVMGVWG